MVRDALVALHADPGLVRLADRAIDDEHRHAALCEEVAGRYLEREVQPYEVLASQQPSHPQASDRVRHILHIAGQCCFNETFASAYLSAAQSGASEPLARHALRELLRDEIDHARVGWGFMHELPATYRRVVSEWLVPLAVCNLREWQSIDLPQDDSLAPFGVPPWEVAQEAILEALTGVILPGFQHVGLDTRALEQWIAAGAHVPALRA